VIHDEVFRGSSAEISPPDHEAKLIDRSVSLISKKGHFIGGHDGSLYLHESVPGYPCGIFGGSGGVLSGASSFVLRDSLINALPHGALELSVAVLESLCGRLTRSGTGFGSYTHLSKLLPIDERDDAVHDECGNTDSNKPSLTMLYLPKLLGGILFALGVVFSAYGWIAVMRSRQRWPICSPLFSVGTD
jgi:hypothetical protein